MVKLKTCFIWFVCIAATVFVVVSLYKKCRINNGDTSAFHVGENYNMPAYDNASMDSLKHNDPYLYALHKGVGFVQEGKADSAILFLKSAIAINDSGAFTNGKLGEAFLAAKQYDSSLYYLNQALRIKPDYSVAEYFKTVAIHRKNGDEDFN